MGEDFFDEGKLISSFTILPNGEKCPNTNLVNGNGTVCYYHDNGQKLYEGNYKLGLQDGPDVWWTENGGIEENATYSNGEELSATRFEYYANGQTLRMTEYKNGAKDGASKEWKMNGDIEKEAIFKNGKEINLTIHSYFKNREKKSISNFKNSKKNGVTLERNENSRLIRRKRNLPRRSDC